jgi:hypothetical protein
MIGDLRLSIWEDAEGPSVTVVIPSEALDRTAQGKARNLALKVKDSIANRPSFTDSDV